jgi:hypothetical protein
MKYLALFILAMILALAPLAHAAPIEYLFCAYTNAGDGGDEGYEVRILGSSSSEDALSASLSLIDPDADFVAFVPAVAGVGVGAEEILDRRGVGQRREGQDHSEDKKGEVLHGGLPN